MISSIFRALTRRRRSAIEKPTNLSEVDPVYAAIKQERDKHRSLHCKGARELQEQLEARMHEHLERGRSHA